MRKSLFNKVAGLQSYSKRIPWHVLSKHSDYFLGTAILEDGWMAAFGIFSI